MLNNIKHTINLILKKDKYKIIYTLTKLKILTYRLDGGTVVGVGGTGMSRGCRRRDSCRGGGGDRRRWCGRQGGGHGRRRRRARARAASVEGTCMGGIGGHEHRGRRRRRARAVAAAMAKQMAAERARAERTRK
jgi:hypothetical protein